jgi:ATP-dependent Clp protease ATP-binding subunit ClpX
MHITSHFSKAFLFSCVTSLVTASFLEKTHASHLTDTESTIVSKRQNLTSVLPYAPKTQPKRRKSETAEKLTLKLKNPSKKRKSAANPLIEATSADKHLAISAPADSFDQPITMPFEINDLHRYLNERILGQNEAMLSLAASIHTHYLSVKINRKITKFNTESTSKGYIPIRKKNILLIGQEGCGKTECVGYIHDFLKQYSRDKDFDFPIVTQSYTSGNPEELIKQTMFDALISSEGDLERTERSLIFIDDIDRQLFSHNSDKRPSAADDIQESWASVLKGTALSIKLPSGKDAEDDESDQGEGINVRFNTHNMLFIAAGRFKTNTHTNLQSHDDNDLEHYGFTSKFIETFQNRILFNQFNTRMLTDIISKPDIPFMRQATTLLKAGYNITLDFDPEALRELAGIAIKGGKCVQALQSTVDRLIDPILKRAPTLRGQTLTISKTDVDALPRIKSKREKFDDKFPGYIS